MYVVQAHKQKILLAQENFSGKNYFKTCDDKYELHP